MKPIIPTEHDEQVLLCKWLELKKIPYNATPNGGFRHKTTARVLKSEGVKAGFPDITVFLPNRIIYIEMKRQKGGVVSPHQKVWSKFLNNLPYASWHVCKGAKEAIEVISMKLSNHSCLI